MADILTAQQQIDNAAKSVPNVSAGPPPEPPPTPPVAAITPTPVPATPQSTPSFGTIHDTPPTDKPPEAPSPTISEPTTPSEPLNSSLNPKIAIREDVPTEPNSPDFSLPNPPKKKKGPGILLAILLFLFIVTIPIGVYFVSQQKQLADLRGRAAGESCSTPGPVCQDGWAYWCYTDSRGLERGDHACSCNNINDACWTTPPGGSGGGGGTIEGQNCSPDRSITCSNGKKHFCQPATHTWSGPGESCSGSNTCNLSGYSCTGTQCFARNAMQASGQCGDVQVDPSLCGANGCGGVTGGGSCSEYTFNVATGKCNASDVGQCRTYSECCAAGKSRIIKATCLSDGREQFDVISSCNDALPAGVCGTATAPGPVTATCPPGQFYWPPPDGDGQCHDISAPANPGGGTANCTTQGGCTGTSGQCIKRWTCTQAELTAQGFCLRNMGAAEFGVSYQAEADATCKYIQVDVYSQQYCPSSMTSTTPHSGTIIYRPANPNGCTQPQVTTPPGNNPTVTTTPQQCQSLLVYDTNGTNITASIKDGTKKLSVGDHIILATPKGQATKAHFRIQGLTDYQDHDAAISTSSEYRLNIAIPSTVTQAQGNFEVEVFVDGAWK